MNENEVEMVMEVINGMFTIPEKYENKLKSRLKELNLRPVIRKEPTWVDGAREIAARIIEEVGEVTIIEVLDEYPLPPEASNRMAGGVFKHKMFNRIDTRTIQDTHGRWRSIGVYNLG
tara:strand:- start:5565 stop:5918 length:354 start_codon:yes stop_codon:yes gene_type:complete